MNELDHLISIAMGASSPIVQPLRIKGLTVVYDLAEKAWTMSYKGEAQVSFRTLVDATVIVSSAKGKVRAVHDLIGALARWEERYNEQNE